MTAASKAQVRSGVTVADANGQAPAPSGEYDIVRKGDGAVAFTSPDQTRSFTLSFDAFCRHVCEGRISLSAAR